MALYNDMAPSLFLLDKEKQLIVGNQIVKLLMSRLKSWKRVDQLINGDLKIEDLVGDEQIHKSEIKIIHKQASLESTGTRIEVYDHKSPVPDEDAKLLSLERRAIEYLLSKQFREKWHFTKSDYGELIDENGEVVFKAATTDALEKALRYL
ncbi:hypothetical protein KO489_07395 [Reinekea forsetii]|nr:hypothetical protein [Reinekea forsetii]